MRWFRCSAMKMLLVIGAIFVIINISFLFLQMGHHSTETACDCARMSEMVTPKTSVASSEADLKPIGASKPATAKPVFNEVIKPNYNDKVKPNKYGDASNMNILSTVQGYFWNKTYQPYQPLHSSSHRLAVVVPFRNRYEEMMEFVPHMHKFLIRQNVSHDIWIINQVDSHRFNRAALLNIGFLLSRKKCDYLVMHDIDLLPLNDDLIYKFPSDGPLHISSPELHPLYHYRAFVGGVLIMSRDQYQQVNGLSNLFWGWGREDDELYVRMQEAKMKVHYPQGIRTGYNTFKHNHDKQKRPRDQKKTKQQWEMSTKRDRVTGASTVKFKLVSKIEMTINGALFNFVNVEVVCDYDLTPYCDYPS